MLIAASNTPAQFTTLSGIMVVLGILIITVLMTRSLRKKNESRINSRPSPRDMMEQIRLHAQRGQTDDVDAANARLLDHAQQLMAQIDNKATRLEQLIVDADDRLERLSDLLRRVDAPQQPTQVIRTQQSMEARAAVSTTTKSVAPPPVTEARTSSQSPRPIDPLTRAVYDLADEGRRPIDIARELDEQVGKIELIIALRGDAINAGNAKGQNVKL